MPTTIVTPPPDLTSITMSLTGPIASVAINQAMQTLCPACGRGKGWDCDPDRDIFQPRSLHDSAYQGLTVKDPQGVPHHLHLGRLLAGIVRAYKRAPGIYV